MDDKQLAQIESIVEKAVSKEINALREEIKPILDAYTGANTLGRFFIWSSKVIFGITLVIGAFIATLKFIIFK